MHWVAECQQTGRLLRSNFMMHPAELDLRTVHTMRLYLKHEMDVCKNWVPWQQLHVTSWITQNGPFFPISMPPKSQNHLNFRSLGNSPGTTIRPHRVAKPADSSRALNEMNWSGRSIRKHLLSVQVLIPQSDWHLSGSLHGGIDGQCFQNHGFHNRFKGCKNTIHKWRQIVESVRSKSRLCLLFA